MEKIKYTTDEATLTEISGSPFAYWVSDKIRSAYKIGTPLGSIAAPRKGNSTSNNNKFLRLWYEVEDGHINLRATEINREESCLKRWYPYNKGGGYRKWYGNNEYLVDWYNDAAEIRSIKSAVIANYQYFCKPGLTWSTVSSNNFSIRWFDEGFIFDNGGCCIFELGNKRLLIAAILNSKVFRYVFGQINPTLNFQSGEVAKFPIMNVDNEEIEKLAFENIEMSKADWDAWETSWDFSNLYICGGDNMGRLISDKYNDWERECLERFNRTKKNEEQINKILIDVYGLQDELTTEVNDEEITIRLANKERDIKSLISYLVGIVMGRYSLDIEGLAYAGGEWNASKYHTYQPDEDGIVPIYEKIGMEDSLTARIIELIKLIYGEDTYRQNIDFIAEALGKNSNESSEETLNRYLNEGFYTDHLKVYQKRPIYWMFSSGKNSGFKCLIYMHRYNKDTLAAINGKYFLPESARLKQELDELLSRIEGVEGRERIRLEKERQKLAAAYNEAIEYGQVLDHMANKYIEIDLDDGVKVNYAKFQAVEMVNDSGTKVKKDLLVPIK